MGTTKTEIYNGALTKIGATRIASLTENSPQRLVLDDAYPNAKNAALQMFGWPFATKRVVLAQDSEAPAFQYQYRYPIPGDVVMILSVWNGTTTPAEDIVWEEENGFILTNEETFSIIYTSNDIVENDFSFMFVQALEYQLGALIALKLKSSRTIMENMIALANEWANKAQTRDANRRSRRTNTQQSSWLTARGATTTIPTAEIL